MNDKARLFDLGNQPPISQLVISVGIVIIAGTLFFHLFVYAGTFIFGADSATMLSIPGPDAGRGGISILKYIQASQQISLFILPVFIISLLMGSENGLFQELKNLPGLFTVFVVIVFAFMVIPVAGYAGILNARAELPGWLAGVEKWMIRKEDEAAVLTNLLILSRGAGELALNVVILAVLPAIGEELFFRGVLQKMVIRIFRSGNAGIWLTAILFSAIHLQFYGFLPRLILGLSFGYLYFLTGNLWTSIIAHFINNTIPVIITGFAGLQQLEEKASDVMERQMLIPLIPLLICAVIIYYFFSVYRARPDYRK